MHYDGMIIILCSLPFIWICLSYMQYRRDKKDIEIWKKTQERTRVFLHDL